MTKVTNVGLSELYKARELTKLNLTISKELTEDAVERLMKALPKTKIEK